MKSITTFLGAALNAAINWLEHGDLVLVMVIVSAVHYAVVLNGRDHWFVAVIIGLLVDLGHYRWVRAAARYDGGKTGQIVTRWTFAIVMTAISFAYHWRYYGGDIWLAAPIPLLIASLAWLAKVDPQSTTRKAKQPDTETVTDTPKVTVGEKLSVAELAAAEGVSQRTMYRRLAERKNGNGKVKDVLHG